MGEPHDLIRQLIPVYLRLSENYLQVSLRRASVVIVLVDSLLMLKVAAARLVREMA